MERLSVRQKLVFVLAGAVAFLTILSTFLWILFLPMRDFLVFHRDIRSEISTQTVTPSVGMGSYWLDISIAAKNQMLAETKKESWLSTGAQSSYLAGQSTPGGLSRLIRGLSDLLWGTATVSTPSTSGSSTTKGSGNETATVVGMVTKTPVLTTEAEIAWATQSLESMETLASAAVQEGGRMSALVLFSNESVFLDYEAYAASALQELYTYKKTLYLTIWGMGFSPFTNLRIRVEDKDFGVQPLRSKGVDSNALQVLWSTVITPGSFDIPKADSFRLYYEAPDRSLLPIIPLSSCTECLLCLANRTLEDYFYEHLSGSGCSSDLCRDKLIQAFSYNGQKLSSPELEKCLTLPSQAAKVTYILAQDERYRNAYRLSNKWAAPFRSRLYSTISYRSDFVLRTVFDGRLEVKSSLMDIKNTIFRGTPWGSALYMPNHFSSACVWANPDIDPNMLFSGANDSMFESFGRCMQSLLWKFNPSQVTLGLWNGYIQKSVFNINETTREAYAIYKDPVEVAGPDKGLWGLDDYLENSLDTIAKRRFGDIGIVTGLKIVQGQCQEILDMNQTGTGTAQGDVVVQQSIVIYSPDHSCSPLVIGEYTMEKDLSYACLRAGILSFDKRDDYEEAILMIGSWKGAYHTVYGRLAGEFLTCSRNGFASGRSVSGSNIRHVLEWGAGIQHVLAVAKNNHFAIIEAFFIKVLLGAAPLIVIRSMKELFKVLNILRLILVVYYYRSTFYADEAKEKRDTQRDSEKHSKEPLTRRPPFLASFSESFLMWDVSSRVFQSLDNGFRWSLSLSAIALLVYYNVTRIADVIPRPDVSTSSSDTALSLAVGLVREAGNSMSILFSAQPGYFSVLWAVLSLAYIRAIPRKALLVRCNISGVSDSSCDSRQILSGRKLKVASYKDTLAASERAYDIGAPSRRVESGCASEIGASPEGPPQLLSDPSSPSENSAPAHYKETNSFVASVKPVVNSATTLFYSSHLPSTQSQFRSSQNGTSSTSSAPTSTRTPLSESSSFMWINPAYSGRNFSRNIAVRGIEMVVLLYIYTFCVTEWAGEELSAVITDALSFQVNAESWLTLLAVIHAVIFTLAEDRTSVLRDLGKNDSDSNPLLYNLSHTSMVKVRAEELIPEHRDMLHRYDVDSLIVDSCLILIEQVPSIYPMRSSSSSNKTTHTHSTDMQPDKSNKVIAVKPVDVTSKKFETCRRNSGGNIIEEEGVTEWRWRLHPKLVVDFLLELPQFCQREELSKLLR